jgi:hypothetical protein
MSDALTAIQRLFAWPASTPIARSCPFASPF